MIKAQKSLMDDLIRRGAGYDPTQQQAQISQGPPKGNAGNGTNQPIADELNMNDWIRIKAGYQINLIS